MLVIAALYGVGNYSISKILMFVAISLKARLLILFGITLIIETEDSIIIITILYNGLYSNQISLDKQWKGW